MNSHAIILITITVVLLSLIDYIPRIFFYKVRPLQLSKRLTKKRKDYCILVTVYNDISYLKNIDFLNKYSKNVYICTTTSESAEFYASLRKICDEFGFNEIRVDATIKNQIIKSAYLIFRLALIQIDAKYCLLMDADTYTNDSVDCIFNTLERTNIDICSLCIAVDTPNNLILKLQDFEYHNAMDSRRIDSWQTSGAAMVGKVSSMLEVFGMHSNFFEGGDSEVGRIAKALKLNIGYIESTFYTQAPDTFRGWFRQRVMWAAGGFRHAIVNIDFYNWQHYIYFFYNTVILYILLPLRYIELINFPYTFLLLIFLSWIYIIIIAKKDQRNRSLIFLPLYSFLQSMIILPLGIIRYFRLVIERKYLGRIKIDKLYHRQNSFFEINLQRILNFSTATIGIAIGFYINYIRISYWLIHGWIFN